jgi:hypothetical protein
VQGSLCSWSDIHTQDAAQWDDTQSRSVVQDGAPLVPDPSVEDAEIPSMRPPQLLCQVAMGQGGQSPQQGVLFPGAQTAKSEDVPYLAEDRHRQKINA